MTDTTNTPDTPEVKKPPCINRLRPNTAAAKIRSMTVQGLTPTDIEELLGVTRWYVAQILRDKAARDKKIYELKKTGLYTSTRERNKNKAKAVKPAKSEKVEVHTPVKPKTLWQRFVSFLKSAEVIK